MYTLIQGWEDGPPIMAGPSPGSDTGRAHAQTPDHPALIGPSMPAAWVLIRAGRFTRGFGAWWGLGRSNGLTVSGNREGWDRRAKWFPAFGPEGLEL